ncbi:hypothetical protein JCM33374_g6494 [Metschnikowia sp. JCM 33374]|nr:hypothetical protein JCM33374_g6494 [Metschnikowia sp. JCM 33374]
MYVISHEREDTSSSSNHPKFPSKALESDSGKDPDMECLQASQYGVPDRIVFGDALTSNICTAKNTGQTRSGYDSYSRAISFSFSRSNSTYFKGSESSISRIRHFGRSSSNTLKVLSFFLLIGLVQANNTTFYEEGLYMSTENIFQHETTPYLKQYKENYVPVGRMFRIAYLLFIVCWFVCSCLRIIWVARQKVKELPDSDALLAKLESEYEELYHEMVYHIQGLFSRLFDKSYRMLRSVRKIINSFPIDDTIGEAVELIWEDVEFAQNLHQKIPKPQVFRFLTIEQTRAIRENCTKYIFDVRRRLDEKPNEAKKLFHIEYIKVDSTIWYESWYFYFCDWIHCISIESRKEWTAHPIIIVGLALSVVVTLATL